MIPDEKSNKISIYYKQFYEIVVCKTTLIKYNTSNRISICVMTVNSLLVVKAVRFTEQHIVSSQSTQVRLVSVTSELTVSCA